MRIPLAVALLLLATPALAQFPPPGAYICTDAAGAHVGQLSLIADGDYAFDGGNGQIASAGTDINPLTGPLKDMELTGSYETDDTGHTVFRFANADGEAFSCS